MGFWERFARGFLQRMEISFFLTHFTFALAAIVVGFSVNKDKKRLIIAAVSVVLLTAFLIFTSNLMITLFWQYYLIGSIVLWGLIAALIIWFGNRYKIRTKIVFWFILMGTAFASMQMIGEASFLVGHYGASDPVFWLVRSLGSLLTLACAVCIKIFNIEKYDKISKGIVALFAIVNMIILGLRILVMVFFDMSRAVTQRGIPNITVAFLACFGGLIVLDLFFYYMVYRNAQAQEDLLLAQAKNLDVERVRELIAMSEKNLGQMREIKHDMSNQLSYMRLLARAGNLKELDAYLQEITFEKLDTFADNGFDSIRCGAFGNDISYGGLSRRCGCLVGRDA